jgi:hypothetical protein
MPDPIRGVSTPDPITPASTAAGATGAAQTTDAAASAAAASAAAPPADQADVGQTEALLQTILDAANNAPGIDQAQGQRAAAGDRVRRLPGEPAINCSENRRAGSPARHCGAASMTLSLPFSGSKPQRGEDRVGGGRLGLPPDPVLYPRQSLGGLMDVVAVGAAKDQRRTGRSASRRSHHRPHWSVSPHPSAFLRGSARIHCASAA